jgi:hypothetical protein
MTRERVASLLTIGAIIAVLIWVANNTYWTNIKVPVPMTGEAATNPFYAVERFATALGTHAQWDRGITLPPVDGVIFISAWDWELTSDRQQRIEHWVESGGRLVVDKSLITSTDAFERWSGIGQKGTETPNVSKAVRRVKIVRALPKQCYTVNEEGGTHGPFSICGLDSWSSLITTRKASWSVHSAPYGTAAVRVKVGRGSVTVINGTPFVARGLFDGDNAAFFVAATQLRHGDSIHFFSERDHASLLELAWSLGWPVFFLGLALLAFALWRKSARFGPLAAPTETARRSLAEQIRGTGQFTLRIGGGESLHAASARALDEAATLHITAYGRLPGPERMSALAQVTGFEPDVLAAALHYPGGRRAEHLRSAVELLESARRRILIKNTRSRHGNRSKYDPTSR